jgi:pre-mRNA-processing factor 6
MSFRGKTPPKDYVPGLGRGAAGFTTRSDVGPAVGAAAAASGNGSRSAQARYGRSRLGGEDGENDDNDEGYSRRPNGSDNQVAGQYDADDDEADRIWDAIDERMAQRRKKPKTTHNNQQNGEASSSTKIAAQFRDLKQGLAEVSEDAWAAIPDVGDYSLKYKQKRQQQEAYQAFTPLTDDLLQRQSELNRNAPQSTAAAADGTQSTAVNMSGLSVARGTVLGMSLDKMTRDKEASAAADGTSTIATATQNTVDKEGYLTSLATSTAQIATSANVADLQKARLLLQSVRSTNPKHAAGWIAAARVEEAANKPLQARQILQQATKACPQSADVWLEAARLHPVDTAKAILATAVTHLPHAIRLYLKAADLEVHQDNKKAVLRKALQANPHSLTLWKAAIDLEDDTADAKALLEVAVEHIPTAVDLWLAWAKLEDNPKQARKVLNKARQAVPTDRSIWMAAAQLEEGQNRDPTPIVQRAVQSLAQHEAIVTRDQWMAEAEHAEDVNCPQTAAAIIHATVGLNVDDPDRLRTWTADAKASVQRGKIETARAILQHTLQYFPSKTSVWKQRVALEKQHGTSASQLDDVLQQACTQLPHVEFFWLLRAKELWTTQNDVEAARQVLAQAFAVNPSSEAVWLAAAKLEWETDEPHRARVLLQRALANASTRRVNMKAALLERAEGQVEAALALIQKGIQAFPDFDKLYMMAGQIMAHDLPKSPETLDKARKFYQRGLQAVPKCATLWILASRLEEDAGSYVPNDAKVAQMAGTKARSLLELARLQHCPQNPDLWLEAIRLENRLGNTKLADTLLSRALQECPTAGILWAEQLRVADKSSQKRKAAEAIQRCPEDVHVIVAVAALFAKDGKEAKARKWFERAVSVDPDHGDAWAYYYAYLKYRLKDQDAQAQIVLQQCVAAEPKHGQLWTSVTKDMQHRLKSTAAHLDLAAQKVVDAGFR